MRRIVFIGCGGSGNAVIGYLMDRLKAALQDAAALHDVDFKGLPQTWQFLVIDARQSPEELPGGLGNVREHGAEYLAVSPSVGAYQVVDSAVSQRAMDGMVTWAPRTPMSITVPIQEGAGQMRAVGRVLLASRVKNVKSALDHAAKMTKEAQAHSDAEALRGICGPIDHHEQLPMAIVISSMAGGSGASMALDVCRLLGGSYNTQSSAMFAFTPDIFDSLPSSDRGGVRPNSLAMLGEITAMQMGQGAGPDTNFLSSLGVDTGGTERIPIRRVIPVGRFASDGTPFGDGSSHAIYRALGSALAALVMSYSALEQYADQQIENHNPNDSTGTALFGWGADQEPLQWGSIGYASLSMGRDRYAEYAAQRLSRATADHLLKGHLLEKDVSGDVQVQKRLASNMEQVRRRLSLPQVQQTASPTEIERAIREWLVRTAFPQQDIQSQIRPVVSQEVVDYLPQAGGDAENLAQSVRDKLHGRRAVLARAAEDIAYRAAFTWHEELIAGIEAEVGVALAQHGAIYARAVLDEVGQQLGGAWGAKALRDLGSKQPGGADAPADLESLLSRLVGTINDVRAAVVEPLRETYRKHLSAAVYGHLATFSASACDDVTKGVVEPLRKALTQLIIEWERETAATQHGAGGLSVTQTALYRLWPAEDDPQVAKRWYTAQNEVLLTDPGIFQERFRTDVVAASATEEVRETPTYQGARQVTIARVVTGEWPTTAGEGSPRTPLAVERRFVASTFKIRPDQPGEVRNAVQGEYRLGLSPASLLERSRMYVARPDASFSTFVRGTIQGYARTAEGEAAIKRGFGELLSKAQPLAQVDKHTYSRVHGDGNTPAVTYSFSTVPFGGLPLADDLSQIIQHRDTGATTLSNFTNSLKGEDEALTQISAFGYFPRVIPPVFDNILKPVREQWASAKVAPESSRQFWEHRRSRPLVGSLAISEEERRAMIGGWLVGQIAGRIRIPSHPYQEPVRVYDQSGSAWVDFPHPLLYPPPSFVRNYEWLPAILESHLLAVANFGVGELRGASMRPYQTLRSLWDASPDRPTNVAGGMHTLGASKVVQDWLDTGEVPVSGVSRCQAASRPQRRERTESFLANIASVARAEAEKVTTADRRREAAVFRDLAQDVLAVIPVIQMMLETEPETEPETRTFAKDGF